MSENIRQFDMIAEKIIHLGYSSFPTAFHVDPAALGLSEEQPSRDSYGSNTYSEDWYALDRLISSVAGWMLKEGYLFSHGQSGLLLSSKGLSLVPALVQGADLPMIVKLG